MTKAQSRALSAPSPHDTEIDDQASGQDAAMGMSKTETAQYIAEFTAELSYLARQNKLDLLAYLLDMAKLEAERELQAEKRKR
ncbi:hypothetical protein [Microvirga solisilvae]|uniref:hypothetical protein n=1 Tax=Microvirga solisilvae TaxID=2919498 RepID=UPI001FB04824|nr:hypothetical protein [Microvirga solisilvae]